MTEVWWFILGAACEAAAVPVTIGNGRGPLALTVFVLLHTFGCLILAVVLPRFHPDALMTKKKVEWLVFSFSFFIPFFGFIGMLLILLYFRLSPTRSLRPEFYSIPQLPFTPRDGIKTVRMGEGGAWARLKTELAPRALKLEALMAAGTLPGRNASRLLRLATGDSDDEIRLAAFNFIDKREKKINDSITRLLGALKEADNDRARGDVCGKLASAYWEFVYNDLAQAELMDFYLDQALSYAVRAEQLAGEKHPLYILKGRIQLRRGNIDEAAQALARAVELGAAPDKTVPFQAEIFFLKRDFDSLRTLLAAHGHLRQKPGIGAVVSFWTEA